MKARIEWIDGILRDVAMRLQSPYLLFVRLYWGWQFAETGWGKVQNIEKVTAFFTTLAIPLPGLNAHFVAGLELAGGVLLMVGLASRWVGFLLTANMLVAYVTADREALTSLLSDPDKFTAATPFPFLMASAMVLLFGPGRLAIDEWLAKRGR